MSESLILSLPSKQLPFFCPKLPCEIVISVQAKKQGENIMKKMNYAIRRTQVLDECCTIKILIVVDGDNGDVSLIQFNDLAEHHFEGAPPFGMGYILDILEQDAPGFVKFEVHCATRESTYSESTQSSQRQVEVNFRFTPEKIDLYDEIWLFGYNGQDDELALNAAELNALHEWMNRGGGILAMGDHEDLGAAICKDIQRVRFMRHWTTSQGVPSRVGEDRYDTNRPATDEQRSGDEYMPFWNQSDNILQPLLDTIDHCILAIPGDQGPLRLFPDHPHEGEVYRDGEGIQPGYDDFPNGSQPETIAWVETFIQDNKTRRAKGRVRSHKFGALGVYDGFTEQVGRIVVDSTWHHWFNINLIGMKEADDQTNYDRYKIFVHNVACWLAPKQQQKQMYLRAIWHSQFTSQVMENYYISNASWTYKDTQEVLKAFVSESFRKDWLSLWYPKELLNPEKESRDGLFHEWSPYKCPHWEVLEAELLQGVIAELRPLILEMMRKKRTSVEEQELTELFEKGSLQGVWNTMKHWSEVIDKQRTMKEMYAAKIR
ncbi:MAG: hypothetical protein F6J86_16025 [Symploca sp. SIO1B1]|nr:hypothetical protein [Symploca sp. SIO1B1]